MNLTALALAKNRVTIVLLLCVTVLGISVYGGMPRDSMPPFTVRTANIVTPFPGAGPERVENFITEPIEKVARELAEVETISSESRTGLSVVTVQLYESVSPQDMTAAWDRMRRKLEVAAKTLPEDSLSPLLKDDEVGLTYGIVVALVSDGFSDIEMERYAEHIQDRLVKLGNAAEIELAGVQAKRIFIDYNQARLSELGLSAETLSRKLAATNIIYSGGSLPLGSERIILEPSGDLRSVTALAETLISLDGGISLPLRDIARVYSGYLTPRESMVRVNGLPAISLHISLKDDANIIALGREVDQASAAIQRGLPHGLSLVRIASEDQVVAKSVGDFVSNLLQSIAVVLLVMFFFLGLRTGLVVASLIPLTLVMTLLFMDVTATGLNKVSLAALIMALGMLVDNAIVITEATMLGMERGLTISRAAIEASSELWLPLLISTLTTTAAFLPFFLAESRMGDMIGPLFVVITIALLSSWLMALVLIPLLSVRLLRVAPQKDIQGALIGRLLPKYASLIRWSLRHRAVVVGVVLLSFVGAIWSFRFVPYVFFPASDRPLVTVDINLPAGTAIEETDRSVARIEGFIQSQLRTDNERPEGVVNWSAFIGEGPPSYDLGYRRGESKSSYAHMLLNTSSDAANDIVIKKLDAFCFSQLPEAKVVIARLASGGNAGAPIEVRLFGENAEVLFKLKSDLDAKLSSLSQIKSFDDSWGPRIKKLRVDIDPARVQRAGLNNRDVAISLQTVLSGKIAGTLRQGSDNIPIVMRSDEATRYQIDQLQGTVLHAQATTANVALAQVAEVAVDWQFSSIQRYDLQRALTVRAYITPDANARAIVQKTLKPWLQEQVKTWPAGYTFALGGEQERGSRGLRSVIDKLPLAAFLILILLMLQFNSMRKTLIVLATVPLGMIGVAIGLHLFRSFTSFFGILGMIALAGIVINNAIVLLSRIEIEQTAGRNRHDAVVFAAMERFRPILLTTFTTALGLVPLYLGGGLLWEPMAISLMVGLLFATGITLVFVPVLYALLYSGGQSN